MILKTHKKLRCLRHLSLTKICGSIALASSRHSLLTREHDWLSLLAWTPVRLLTDMLQSTSALGLSRQASAKVAHGFFPALELLLAGIAVVTILGQGYIAR